MEGLLFLGRISVGVTVRGWELVGRRGGASGGLRGGGRRGGVQFGEGGSCVCFRSFHLLRVRSQSAGSAGRERERETDGRERFGIFSV